MFFWARSGWVNLQDAEVIAVFEGLMCEVGRFNAFIKLKEALKRYEDIYFNIIKLILTDNINEALDFFPPELLF